MGIVERRERDRQALREEILAAARALFIEQGYESVSMRKIASRIEYSPTAIYLYFKDKAELLRSICDETFSKLAAALEQLAAKSASGAGDPIAFLKQGLYVYVEFGLAHPDHYQLTFLTRHHDRPEEKLDMGLRAFSHLTSAVQACVTAGRFRDNDVAAISQALWAAVHGVTALLIQQTGFPFVARKKLIHRVIDSMVDGLSPVGAAWHP